MDEKKLLKAKDVAKLLGIDVKTLKSLIRRGKIDLSYLMVGSQWRFKAASVERFLEDAVNG